MGREATKTVRANSGQAKTVGPRADGRHEENPEDLLRAAGVVLVVLDRQLRIRQFTPAAASFLALRTEDVGRSITAASGVVEAGDWSDIVSAVTGRRREAEAEIKTRDGRWYLLRARPHGAGKAQAVVVLTEIDELRRKLDRTVETLRERETMLAVAREAGRIGTWDWNVITGEIRCNEQWARLRGAQEASEIILRREAWLAFVHQEDRSRLARELDLALRGKKSYDAEYRVLWPDSSVHWLMGRGKVFWDEKGGPVRMVGLSLDITARHNAEDALRENETVLRQVTARLLAAREDERRLVACELHDDFNQRMAMLSNEVVSLQKEVPWGLTARRILDTMQARVSELSEDLRRAAHQLYPPALEHFGLVMALEALCAEFSKAYPIAVHFAHRNVPAMLRGDEALCLYRVAQESLKNVVRHAEATAAEVRLERKKDRVRLSVSDNGKGFDPERSKKGLGLISIQERVRALGGTVSLDPGPGRGTSLLVEVSIDRRHM
jgi:PAS domain-containing protein/two-component sensor histidine kinase